MIKLLSNDAPHPVDVRERDSETVSARLPTPPRQHCKATEDKLSSSRTAVKPTQLVNTFTCETGRPSPTASAQSVHIIGGSPTKTAYNRAEFAKLKKNLCPNGQPLVLVQKKISRHFEQKFLVGAQLLERLDAGEISKDELRAYNAYLIYGHVEDKSPEIPLDLLLGPKNNLSLVYALLGVNSLFGDEEEIHARQFVISAMLRENVLGFTDLGMAEKITRQIPKNEVRTALNLALFACANQEESSLIKLLLQWGADPNAQQADDDLSILGVAIRRLNKPMIQTLLAFGADPDLETDSDMSAAALVKLEPYQTLAPLFGENRLDK